MSAPTDPIKRDEWRKKLSKTLTGRVVSDETRAKISNAMSSEENRRKTSERMRGRKKTGFDKKGWHHSEESRRKISEATRGEKNPIFGKPRSEETCKKISASKRGKPRSDETRKKIAKSHLGKKRKPFSAETRRKMSASRIGEKCHLWKGGISFEPYSITFNEAFKRFVRDYYGNVCINCGKTREENGQELTCHHYDYDKHSMNCVPTCNGCNSMANGGKKNGSRAFWEDWYTEILSEFFPKN
jgi:hypothetical protein